jgi:hypothetical protein
MRRLGATAVMTAVMGLVVLASSCKPYGERVEAPGQGEIFIKPPVTKDQATRLGVYLQSVGFFDGKRRKSIQVRKKGKAYMLRFVVKKQTAKDATVLRALKIVTGMASREVFDRAPMILDLCDKRFKSLREVALPKGFGDFGERLLFGRGEVFIRKPVTVAQGNKVGELLLKQGFFNKKQRKSVQLLEQGGTYRLNFVTKAKTPPKIVKSFRGLGVVLSAKALGGASVQVALCNELLEPRKVLPKVAAGLRTAHGKGELYRLPGVSQEQAVAIAAALTKAKYFNETNVRAVQLDKQGGRFIVRFVMAPGSERRPDVQQAFSGLMTKIAPAFNGVPVDVWFADPYFAPLGKLALAPSPPPSR